MDTLLTSGQSPSPMKFQWGGELTTSPGSWLPCYPTHVDRVLLSSGLDLSLGFP